LDETVVYFSCENPTEKIPIFFEIIKEEDNLSGPIREKRRHNNSIGKSEWYNNKHFRAANDKRTRYRKTYGKT
jgi:hypothetical protein